MQTATAQSHRAGRRSRILLLALGGLLVGCAPKSGVRAPLPERGDPVRVTIGHSREVLEFRELRGDVLVLQGESGNDLRSIPLASVDELEAVVGRERKPLRGAAWGLAVGAVFGAFVGLATTQSSCKFFEFFCSTGPAEENAVTGAKVFGGLGAPLGLIIGAATSTAVWAPVEPSALAVEANASPGGLGLQLIWRP